MYSTPASATRLRSASRAAWSVLRSRCWSSAVAERERVVVMGNLACRCSDGGGQGGERPAQLALAGRGKVDGHGAHVHRLPVVQGEDTVRQPVRVALLDAHLVGESG